MNPYSMGESTRRKKAPKILRSLEHQRTPDGTHVFTHHYYDHPSEHKSFGADNEREASAHFHKHAGMSIEEQGGSEPEPFD